MSPRRKIQVPIVPTGGNYTNIVQKTTKNFHQIRLMSQYVRITPLMDDKSRIIRQLISDYLAEDNVKQSMDIQKNMKWNGLVSAVWLIDNCPRLNELTGNPERVLHACRNVPGFQVHVSKWHRYGWVGLVALTPEQKIAEEERKQRFPVFQDFEVKVAEAFKEPPKPSAPTHKYTDPNQVWLDLPSPPSVEKAENVLDELQDNWNDVEGVSDGGEIVQKYKQPDLKKLFKAWKAGRKTLSQLERMIARFPPYVKRLASKALETEEDPITKKFYQFLVAEKAERANYYSQGVGEHLEESVDNLATKKILEELYKREIKARYPEVSDAKLEASVKKLLDSIDPNSDFYELLEHKVNPESPTYLDEVNALLDETAPHATQSTLSLMEEWMGVVPRKLSLDTSLDDPPHEQDNKKPPN